MIFDLGDHSLETEGQDFYVAENATVFDGPGGNLLREGTNGWTCLPANPRGMSDPENGWIDPHEEMPACGDAEFLQIEGKVNRDMSSSLKPQRGWKCLFPGQCRHSALNQECQNKNLEY